MEIGSRVNAKRVARPHPRAAHVPWEQEGKPEGRAPPSTTSCTRKQKWLMHIS